MIVLNLSCPDEHVFEGWFASSAAFEDQLARGLVSCPICSSRGIRRLPSAPYVQTRTSMPGTRKPVGADEHAGLPASAASSPPSQVIAQVVHALRNLARDAEDVGERLPEEARRIHYGEAEARNIRGAASRDDVEALLDEGIMVLPVPVKDDDLH
ncbi:DUF1178 family protein [Thauera sp.]|uniref:DUF1178 family protein n=1 Tax=Thauera sp. TaxID=1905334 RepID=UPI000ED9120D|nr:DUF1178 family protein [Thauera sp.]HAG75088.1 DUF1178 domain-containing protein [Thauera sp.]